MGDLAWSYDPDSMTADLALDAWGSPAVSDDLQTAVILSLGTDARAGIDDRLPDHGDGDRRGWWGDALPPADLATDTYGSLFWLLSREKQLPAVLARAEGYDTAALQWLVDDGIASRVDVAASFPATGRLADDIAIYRPAAPPARYRFDLAWQAQAMRPSAALPVVPPPPPPPPEPVYDGGGPADDGSILDGGAP